MDGKEKPIGMVKKVFYNKKIEIFWLNEQLAKRYAVKNIQDPKKLEIINSAH